MKIGIRPVGRPKGPLKEQRTITLLPEQWKLIDKLHPHPSTAVALLLGKKLCTCVQGK